MQAPKTLFVIVTAGIRQISTLRAPGYQHMPVKVSVKQNFTMRVYCLRSIAI